MPAEEKKTAAPHYVAETVAPKVDVAKVVHEIAESIRGCKCDSGEIAALAAKVEVLAAKYEKK